MYTPPAKARTRPGARLLLVLALLLTAVPAWAQSNGPSPDPTGAATGDRTSVTDAAGNVLVVTEPSDPKAPDYADRKKAYDEYRAQAEKEPLALKLADGVGHLKIATNTSWTLSTGYLVLFMQAGFALLTCGLVGRRTPVT